MPCPCNFSLGSTALIATRECGGDFVTRAVWLEPDTTACEFSVTTRKLCRLADVSYLISIFCVYTLQHISFSMNNLLNIPYINLP